jgi:hypothetical protein
MLDWSNCSCNKYVKVKVTLLRRTKCCFSVCALFFLLHCLRETNRELNVLKTKNNELSHNLEKNQRILT